MLTPGRVMLLPLLVFLSLEALTEAQTRMAPGVPPGQYQGQGQHQQPPPPPQQQHYQGGAPGVPPQQYQPPPQQQQQYQQQPPQQQYQQPPPQQQYQQPPPQQQPQQYQPPPPQHQPQVQGVQQQPQGGHHGGHHNQHQQQRVLHNPNLSQERDHIKEHLEVPIDTAGMSEQELQFHYFKMHDADNNNKLDGQELIKSLFHWHDESNHDPTKGGHQPPPEPKLFTDDELVNMIDPILDQDDQNRDGFIDYPEFVQAQRNAAANQAGKNAA